MADERKDRFVAHVTITPDDGGEPYTVETEFTATSYPTAWEHVMGFGQKFGGRVTSHRLAMVGEKILTTPVSPVIVPRLPAPQTTALTVKAEVVVPDWVSKYCVGMPTPKIVPDNGVII